MKVQHIFSQHQEISDFLTQKIDEEAKIEGITEDSSWFVFVIRDHNNEIIAGCNGAVVYGAIYTDQLWVRKDYRKQGLAKLLMEEVHVLGKERNCNLATVCTLSFQHAKSFYEDLGYVCDFVREGFANDSACFFLKKELNK